MTNKEAIEVLEQMKAQIANDQKWLALHRAIKALEERPQGETKAEIFKQTFGIYATEVWAMSEAEFLDWINADMREEAQRENRTSP